MITPAIEPALHEKLPGVNPLAQDLVHIGRRDPTATLTGREAGLPGPARDVLQRIVTGCVPLKELRDETCTLAIRLDYLRSHLIYGGFQQRPSNPNRDLLRFRDGEASDVAQDEQCFDSNAERQSRRQAFKT